MRIKGWALVGFIGMAVLTLSGCSRSSETPNTTTPSETREAPSNEETSEASSMNMEDWSMALAKGEKLHCSYLDANGENAEFFADGMRYRTEIATEEGKMVSVFDGETVYVWNDGEGTGFFQTMDCLKELQKSFPEETDIPETYESSEDVLLATPNMQCNRIATVDLSVPDSVEFSDQCAMMKDQMKMMEDMMENLPESFDQEELLP
jgi:hypothetical protein